VTPSTLRSCAASGEGCGGANVDRGDRYSRNVDGKLSGRMVWFGLNLSASSFGVVSVCMKIVRLDCVVGTDERITGWLRGCSVGRSLLLVDEMGVCCGAFEKCLGAVASL